MSEKNNSKYVEKATFKNLLFIDMKIYNIWEVVYEKYK